MYLNSCDWSFCRFGLFIIGGQFTNEGIANATKNKDDVQIKEEDKIFHKFLLHYHSKKLSWSIDNPMD